jgi:hypothetical protein
MMPLGSNSATQEHFADRSEYLAHLQRLAAECNAEEPDETPPQLLLLAEALERLASEVSEIRAAQDASASAALALERRVSALEHSTPSPQSWRDLIQGIRGIREAMASQAARQQIR